MAGDQDDDDVHWEARELRKDMRFLRAERERWDAEIADIRKDREFVRTERQRSDSARKTRLNLVVQAVVAVLTTLTGGVVTYFVAIKTGK